MHLRRVFTVYILTLALCLVFLSNRTSPDPPQVIEWYGGPADVLVPEGADSPPESLATPKGSRAVEALDLGDFDIPLTALLAYQRAADILAEVRPGCELPWTLLAAIGRVESNHGRYAGATLGSDGVPSRPVVGVALNGQGKVAEIRDTDGGALDQDPTWDRAVGPMQFIPSTWEMVGVDGDGDGVRSIHDIDDAALAAGVYLCAGSSDLRDPDAMQAALYRYNDSAMYVALVMAYEEAYRGGDFNISSPGGQVTAASAVLNGPTLGATPIPPSARPDDKVRARIEANARKAVTKAIEEGARTPGISASTTSPSTSPSASSGATPSETRAGQSAGPTGPASTSPSGGTTGTSTPTPEGSGSADPSSSPATPETSEPAVDPSETTQSESAPTTPSEPASESPTQPESSPPSETTSGTPSEQTSTEPEACETGSGGPDATPSPTPTDGGTADPCATESPAPATEATSP
jgi:hypothetical protein